MQTYKKKFACKATLRVELGSKIFDDSHLVKFIVTPRGSPDVKLKDVDGKEIYSSEIAEIRYDLWIGQLEEIVEGLQKVIAKAKA